MKRSNNNMDTSMDEDCHKNKVSIEKKREMTLEERVGGFEDPYYDEADSEDERILKEHAQLQNEQAQTEGQEDMDMEDTSNQPKQLFRPGIDQLEDGERMDYDPSAYIMYHRLRFQWPSLSFDFVRDKLGANRTKFPLSCFLVAGTQADHTSNNTLDVVRLNDLCKTREQDEDEEDDDDDDTDSDPVMTHRSLKHTGGVNRVRCMPQSPNIVATWADTGRVYLWNVAGQLNSLGYDGNNKSFNGTTLDKPIFAFKGHKDEGFAMDWSLTKQGRLITGDCQNKIYLWNIAENGQCTVNDVPFTSHTGSVEDLQWNPSEDFTFASCSVDKTIKIWDIRNNKAMLSVDAHDTDVNVISWNRTVGYLLASGSDDGSFKIWDIRKFTSANNSSSYVGHYQYHKAPICSVEWHPTDESVVAVSCADNSVSVWDLALEEDVEHANATPGLQSEILGSDMKKLEIPPQLLFLHQGQSDPKELHFHPQLPGVIGSTAADGFDMFICEPLDPKQNHPKQ